MKKLLVTLMVVASSLAFGAEFTLDSEEYVENRLGEIIPSSRYIYATAENGQIVTPEDTYSFKTHYIKGTKVSFEYTAMVPATARIKKDLLLSKGLIRVRGKSLGVKKRQTRNGVVKYVKETILVEEIL